MIKSMMYVKICYIFIFNKSGVITRMCICFVQISGELILGAGGGGIRADGFAFKTGLLFIKCC